MDANSNTSRVGYLHYVLVVQERSGVRACVPRRLGYLCVYVRQDIASWGLEIPPPPGTFCHRHFCSGLGNEMMLAE